MSKIASRKRLLALSTQLKRFQAMFRKSLMPNSIALLAALALSSCAAPEKQLVAPPFPSPPVNLLDPIPQEALPWLMCLQEKGSHSLDCRSLEPSLSPPSTTIA